MPSLPGACFPMTGISALYSNALLGLCQFCTDDTFLVVFLADSFGNMVSLDYSLTVYFWQMGVQHLCLLLISSVIYPFLPLLVLFIQTDIILSSTCLVQSNLVRKIHRESGEIQHGMYYWYCDLSGSRLTFREQFIYLNWTRHH